MKHRRVFALGSFALLLSVTAAPVHAQAVHVDGQPCPIPVIEDALEPSEVTDFSVWGYTEPGVLLVQIGSRQVHVARENLEALLPQLDLNSFPDVTGKETIQAGSAQDEVKGVQEALSSLGFLNGAADGIFGQGTSSAIRSFQTAHGLPDTGVADLATQLALQSAAAGTLDQLIEVIYPSEITVENRFGELADKIDADLEKYLDPSWKFSYDVFEGRGSLDPGLSVGTYAVQDPAIDRITMTMNVKVVLNRPEGEEKVELIPALTVDSRGAYRPYVQDVILQSGVDVCTVKGAVITGDLNGTVLTEKAYIPMTGDAVTFIEEHETVNMRLEGKNDAYDFSLENRDQILEFLKAVM